MSTNGYATENALVDSDWALAHQHPRVALEDDRPAVAPRSPRHGPEAARDEVRHRDAAREVHRDVEAGTRAVHVEALNGDHVHGEDEDWRPSSRHQQLAHDADEHSHPILRSSILLADARVAWTAGARYSAS